MNDDRTLHQHLIGRQGGRASLNTPALVIDLDAMQANIARMAAFAKASGLALRPHAKTHKSARIARLQVEGGAVGVCCAKIGEAEAIAAGDGDGPGAESILITSPVVTPQAIERLIVLNQRLPDLRVVVDDVENAAALARAVATGPAGAQASARKLNVLIDIDPGIHRTGAASPEAAVALAKAIQAAPQLTYAGVQFYCGREQHIASFDERRDAIRKRFAYLRTVLDALTAAGAAPPVVTGGGTGTHVIDAELGVLTELQAGSYVFMDRQYLDCDTTGPSSGPFLTSLFIDASVISANTPGMATLDAGFKAMAADGGPPAFHSGAPAAAEFRFMGDEHGALIQPKPATPDASPAAAPALKPGDRVVLTTPHCDPTVNLYDWYHVVHGDTLVDIWPVSARGRSR
jgi:D-serine deaminase-like pyridoxal phosphate-dependent protein